MIKVSTERFKTAVNKAIKGASNDQLHPLTQMIGIKAKNNKLYLCTTDKANDLQIILDDITADDFSITVQADLFAKLVSKVTSETISMEIKDNVLQVTANGKYKIPLEVDESGLIEFPDIKFNKVGTKAEEINMSIINSMYAVGKNSVDRDTTMPYLGGYRISENGTMTAGGKQDIERVVLNKNKIIDNDLLINAQMLYLLTLNNSDTIKMCKRDNQLYFYSNNMIICGQELDGKELYPVNELSEFLSMEFPSMCKLPKTMLESVLDRLELFVSPYDRNAIKFIFDNENVSIQNKDGNGNESITYTASERVEIFSCELDLQMLKEQLQSIQDDNVEIHFGSDSAIKLISKDVVYVLALVEEDSIEE